MKRSGFRYAALALLAILLAANFYRAATQSLVHDEAFSWELYLSGPVSAIFQTYTANNHFLATLLIRLSVTLFGDSEFAMRLPAVLAGGWFFWTVLQLCGLVFGDGWFFLLGCSVLTLNPFLLDFLVAARGYGLAVTGLFWALFQMLAWYEERERDVAPEVLRKRLWKAALGCSIAVASNFTLLLPVFLLAALFCVVLLKQAASPEATNAQPPPKPRKKPKKGKPEAVAVPRRAYASVLNFAGAVAVFALVFVLSAPIEMVRNQDLYTGSPTAVRSLRSLINVSFAYGNRPGLMQQLEQAFAAVAIVLLPVLTLAALAFLLMRPPLLGSSAGLMTLFSSVAVVGSAILIFAAHLVTGIPYPEDRTGIYFMPLATLAVLGLARLLMDLHGTVRWVGVAISAVLALFALEFAAQFNVHSFWVWRYDADTKRVYETLEAAAKPNTTAPNQVRLGVSWVFEPALNYYRDRGNDSWLAPVQRDGFDGARQFYIVSSDDQRTAPSLPKMKEIYRGPLTGTLLAVPAAP